jgi:hypothetical protein
VTTRSRAVTLAGIGLAAAVGITGCGSSSQGTEDSSRTSASTGTPKDKVLAAFRNLDSSSSASFTLALDGTFEGYQKLAAADPDFRPPADSDAEIVKQSFNGQTVLTVSAPEGQTLGDATQAVADLDFESLLKDPAALEATLKNQAALGMSWVQDGSGLFEFVAKDGVFYLRADKIAELSEQDLGSLESQLDGLPPIIATPVQKLLAGEWVSLDLIKTVKLLDEQGLLDEIPQETASPAVDQAELQSLLDSAEAAFQADAEITEIDGGDRGDGYQVTVPVKQFATAVQDDWVNLFNADPAEVKSAIGEIKADETVVLDVFVQDEKLSGLNLDLVQFADKPVEDAEFGIDLTVDAEADALQAPGGATAVDIAGIFGLIPADLLPGASSGF